MNERMNECKKTARMHNGRNFRKNKKELYEKEEEMI